MSACIFASSLLGQSDNDLNAKVDGLFAKWDRTDSPGCAVAIIQDGETLYTRGYGAADLDHGVAIGPQSVFDVASVSKQFTAAAIVLLAQDGKLSLDDPIRRHLPQLPDYANPVTIRHLIHHQSGMPEVVDLFGLDGGPGPALVTAADVMSLLVRQKTLSFAPGERFLYSNINYITLGWIVERVSGQSLREFTTKRIFEPLGMKNTHFSDDHAEIIRNRASAYWKVLPRYGGRPEGYWKGGTDNYEYVGSSNLRTTVEDLALWLNNFEEPHLGGVAFIEQMLEMSPPVAQGKGLPYAFGLNVDEYRGLRRVWHGGRMGGLRSMAALFLDQSFAVVCLCNSREIDPGPLALQVADWYLADHIEAQVDPAPREQTVALGADQLARYEGSYWSCERSSGPTSIRTLSGKLKLAFSDEDEIELRPLGGGRFSRSDGEPVVLFEPRNGEPLFDLVITTDGGLVYRFEPLSPYNPAQKEIRAYVGAYYSDELDVVFRIAVEDGGLLVNRRWQSQPSRLEPILPDVFHGRLGCLTFERDSTGAVTGFSRSHNDLKVHFERVDLD